MTYNISVASSKQVPSNHYNISFDKKAIPDKESIIASICCVVSGKLDYVIDIMNL